MDFTTILSGIVDGSLDVEMRKEKETVNEYIRKAIDQRLEAGN